MLPDPGHIVKVQCPPTLADTMLVTATLTVATVALLTSAGGWAPTPAAEAVRLARSMPMVRVPAPLPSPQVADDSAAIRSHARELQGRFERRRLRELPRTQGGGSHQCDDIIGRLCIWDDGDEDWTPQEEPEAIGRARAQLLASLDSLARMIPGDHWVFGQRIRYLAEAGRLGDAESLARACGLPGPWRCDAYLGFVHHRQERTGSAERAFRRTLEAMPADTRAEWTDPDPVLDRDLRDWLRQADSTRALARLWTLADPLFLVEGNDRWTAHLSRQVYAMSSEGARSPHQLLWGDDLTEAVVRYGWPVAWERSWPRVGQTSFSVTGRDPPAAVRTFPPREVLDPDPAGAEPIAWEIEDGHSRSVHLPAYLDSLGVLEGQVGRFWRRSGVTVVGAGTAEGASPILAGLFLEQDGDIEVDVRTSTEPGGAVRLLGRAPWADWGVVSLEAWDPDARRAYRLRAAMGFRELPPDLFALSDVMLLEAGAEPDTFAEMVDALRGSTEVGADEALSVAFEVYGLGFRAEAVNFRAWVEKREEGFFSRAARWLRISGPKEEVSLRWEEAGPDEPRPHFRALKITLPGLDPGEYVVVVEATVAGRSPLSGRRPFTVRQ